MNNSKPAMQPGDPPRRPPLFTRGDKGWALCFALTLVVLWPLQFLFGLSPSSLGGFGIIAVIAGMIAPLGLLAGLLLVALTSPIVEKEKERRLQKFLGRLGLLVVAAFVAAAVLSVGGGPWGLGRLCAAKWGIGLDAIRKLQDSDVVVGIGKGENARILESDEIPESLNSIYWGHPGSVIVEPRQSGPHSIQISWGGGFLRWGIAVGPGGECPLAEDDYELTHWAEDVWVFRER